MKKKFLLKISLCFCFGFYYSSAAFSVSLQISPIRIDINAEQPAAALTLFNTSDSAINTQVRVYAWSQTLNKDNLEITQDIIASPPMIKIPPNSQQVIRIIRTNLTPSFIEKTYRLLIDELQDEDENELNKNGIQIQLRYSVPVFDNALLNEGSPNLFFSLNKNNEGSWFLTVKNNDKRHAQLSEVSIEWEKGKKLSISKGLLGYVLPLSTRQWQIKDLPSSISHARIKLFINGTEINKPLSSTHSN